MKNLLFTILSISIISCSQEEYRISNDFFQNSDFIEVYEEDTIHLSFLDTTYSILNKNGIQQNSNWSIKTAGNEQLLLLGVYCPRVLQILDYSDSSCTLKGITHKEGSSFVLQKVKTEKIQFQGVWKSSTIPPPPATSLNNIEKNDSIFKNENLWESEVFEFTEDSVIYSFYDYKVVVKYEKPFIQLEKDIKAANGRLSVIRPIDKTDSILTLEFYYTDGRNSPEYENKKWIRKLKTVANTK